MFGLSMGHLIILTVIILLFQAKRLPELGHALGKGMGAFKKGLEGRDADDTGPGHHGTDDPKLPLLERVDHPVAVDPDAILAAHAAERGWPIISLR